MRQIPHFLSLLLLPTMSAAIDWTVNAGNSTKCYTSDGKWTVPKDSGGQWIVCDPTQQISSCCHVSDYCMSNGLCLNAGGNNLLSVQGCTNQDWAGSCNRVCGDNVGVTALLSCKTDGSAWTCTGNCSERVNVRVGQILQVGHALTTTAPPARDPTPTSDGTTPTSIAPGSETSAPPQQSNNQNTAIGLGVGIPLGLILIGALIWFGFQYRKAAAAKGQYSNVTNPTEPTGTAEPKYAPSSTAYSSTVYSSVPYSHGPSPQPFSHRDMGTSDLGRSPQELPGVNSPHEMYVGTPR